MVITDRRKLLLTGAGGMVGRNILEHPLLAHWNVLAPRRDELDLCDSAATERYLKEQRPDVVIHTAGLVGGIQTNIARPVDFLVINMDIGKNIVMAARAAGVRRFINLASSCMYPRDAASPLSEDLILQGSLEHTNEGYALAKIMVTRLCEYVHREKPMLEYKTLIPCNLYGRYDKFGAENSHLLPAIIHKIHTAKTDGVSSVEIWGDGTARREFMYAGDCADAVVRAVDRFESLPFIMNVGMGNDHSVQDYYQAAAEVIGWTGEFVYNISKPVGMKRKMVSIVKQAEWGWSPSVSLVEGIRRTYQYYLTEVRR